MIGKEIALEFAELPPRPLNQNQMLLASGNPSIFLWDQMTADDYLEAIYKQAPTEPEARKHWFGENFERVAVSPEFVLTGVSTDEPLRRFIDLPKLFDMLKNRRLVLPRLKELIRGDPFECRAKKSFDHLDRAALELRARELKEYAPESIQYPPRILPPPSFGYSPPQFDSEIQQMTLEALKDAVWYLERERLQWDLVCSCWYRGTVESDAMWRIYAPQLGVFNQQLCCPNESRDENDRAKDSCGPCKTRFGRCSLRRRCRMWQLGAVVNQKESLRA